MEDCFAHRGAGIRLEGTIMGGTEQNQARRALEKARDAKQESEDQLRMMIDSIPTLAWACRPDGTTEFLNQAAGLDYTGLLNGTGPRLGVDSADPSRRPRDADGDLVTSPRLWRAR